MKEDDLEKASPSVFADVKVKNLYIYIYIKRSAQKTEDKREGVVVMGSEKEEPWSQAGALC